ncbi:ubiquinol-cytochrome-c reductase complex assembly factor 2-like [Oppia nitens]|uniref:ubiquinol-cytochrome-c reductase complex assembly factor 2-like n=1 Tax=Oppia nitens TaxID=1686743 RepID=UPI0023DB5BAC|nr:ubiquinol-cytochrome-c reductase complex assembly factor 2-like [Oppia nitens]
MSSVSALYRRYLLVCNQWSIDTTKTGRDFATHLRQELQKLFPKAELTDLKTNELKDLEENIAALERLNRNIYFKPTFYESSASGLTADECKRVISTEGLKELEIQFDRSFVSKFKDTFGSIRFKSYTKLSEEKQSEILKKEEEVQQKQ